MHDVMDSSKRVELDRIIKDLESCGESKTPSQLLEVFGRCVALIPAVERLLDTLSNHL